jgi:hypothetical protein
MVSRQPWSKRHLALAPRERRPSCLSCDLPFLAADDLCALITAAQKPNAVTIARESGKDRDQLFADFRARCNSVSLWSGQFRAPL